MKRRKKESSFHLILNQIFSGWTYTITIADPNEQSALITATHARLKEAREEAEVLKAMMDVAEQEEKEKGLADLAAVHALAKQKAAQAANDQRRIDASIVHIDGHVHPDYNIPIADLRAKGVDLSFFADLNQLVLPAEEVAEGKEGTEAAAVRAFGLLNEVIYNS